MRQNLFCLSLLMVLLLGACGTLNKETVENTHTGDEVSGSEEIVTSDDALSSGTASDASDIKNLPVEVEGQVDMRPAQFHRSGLGYSIYILEDYTLTSEEPNRDIIMSNYDATYFTRVIVHGEQASASEIKDNLIEHAGGTLNEVDIPLTGFEFALLEEYDEAGEKTSIYHVAKTYNGHLVQFTIHLPVKEPIEGIEPSFWSMLETVDY